VDTLDEFGIVHAPGPVEPGDLVADAEAVYRVEVVLPPDGRPRPVEPVLARRVEKLAGTPGRGTD
jgi:hypothetical protein